MSSDPLDQSKLKLSRDIAICEEVKLTLETKGWREYICPILESMINEIDGGRYKDSRWHKGQLCTNTNNHLELIGRKGGLIDFYNRVHDHLIHLNRKKEELTLMDNPGYIPPKPPMEDTRYVTTERNEVPGKDY